MLTILCLLASTAFAGSPSEPPTPSEPPSQQRGGGRGGGEESADRLMKNFPEIAKRIGLSTEQKASIEKLYYENKSAGIDLKAKGEKGRLELERLMLADTVDEKAVMKAFDTAALAETEVRKNDLKLMLGIRKQLTAEQWSSLRSMRDEVRGERREKREKREQDESDHED